MCNLKELYSKVYGDLTAASDEIDDLEHAIEFKTVNAAQGYQLMADKNNNVIMFLAILVFLWFSKKNLDNRFTRLLTKLSPYTLAVYLIHQGMINNRKLWIFNIQETYTVPILLHCLLVCCLIFAVCVAIDVCRDCTFRMLRIGKIFDVIVSKLPKGLIS